MKIIKVIDIDCRDIKPIMRDLLVYVSDQAEAIPTIKSHGFALEPFGEKKINSVLVVDYIKEYLNSVGEGKKYAVIAQNESITISSVSGEPMKGTDVKEKPSEDLFSCTHCGYVTRFETDLNSHRVIHYL
ncbi:MAG: Zinc finger C2H2-type domain-containing protein [Cenarchaeum symbiont of Oopsacas minuta]|nr:Zinc finger C2H2-type domain-containing protein [Cenarchaeum symbiont of Oopsacas minuta]